MAGQIEGHRVGQPGDAPLARGVDRAPFQAGLRPGRDVEDAPPPLGNHRLGGVTAHGENPFDVDGDDRVELLLRRLPYRRHAVEPRVVHQHVEPAVLLDAVLDDPARLVPPRHAAAVGGGLAAGIADLARHALGLLNVDVIDQHPGALGGHSHGVRPPQAAPRSRDDDRLAFKHTHTALQAAQYSSRSAAHHTRRTPYRSKSGSPSR